MRYGELAGNQSKVMASRVDKKRRTGKMGRGIFTMLAIGTLPTLFSNPSQYIMGLVICAGIAFGLARLL